MIKWHRVPKALKPLITAMAAYNYAFEYPELYAATHTPDMPIGVYKFMFFDLMETTGGTWYFKMLATDPENRSNSN